MAIGLLLVLGIAGTVCGYAIGCALLRPTTPLAEASMLCRVSLERLAGGGDYRYRMPVSRRKAR